jgi:hypothetical protein
MHNFGADRNVRCDDARYRDVCNVGSKLLFAFCIC